VSDAVDRAADELYGLPLADFVPRRDSLVRELRAAGQKDDAEMVKKMAKPTAPAWVVNQLAREQPDEMRELMDAGRELRRVQEWLIRREADPADLRSAVEAERAAVARLVHAGADLLTAAGRPPRGDILERVGETLHAATADSALRAEVERGRVVRDQAAVGLGAATGAGFAPAGATRRTTRRPAADPDAPPPAEVAAEPPKPKAPRGKSKSADTRRKAADAAAQAELRAAEAEAKAAERTRASADRAVERATRALAAAEESWDRAREQLQATRDQLTAAERSADAAREDADAAAAEAQEKRRQATAGED
jgi:hypothetical protein